MKQEVTPESGIRESPPYSSGLSWLARRIPKQMGELEGLQWRCARQMKVMVKDAYACFWDLTHGTLAT